MKNRSLIAHETLSWRARARFQKAVARWQTPLRSSISMQTEIIHRAVTHIHHYNLSGASVPDTSISFAHAGSIATSGSSESCALAKQKNAEHVGTTEAAPNVHKSASTGEVQNERGKYRRQRADAVFDFSLTSFGFLVEEGGSSI